MEIEVVLNKFLPKSSGTSARGRWEKLDVVFEQPHEFNKKLCVEFWGDKIVEIEKFPTGSKVKLSLNIDSREYNGRWYTSVRAWKVESVDVQQQSNNGFPDSQDLSQLTPPIDCDTDMPF